MCELMNGNLEAAKKYLNRYESFDLLFNDNMPDEPLDLTPFPIANRLCSIFPELECPLNKNLRIRLSFCLPKVSPP